MMDKTKLLKLIEDKVLTLSSDEISIKTLKEIAILLKIDITNLNLEEL